MKKKKWTERFTKSILVWYQCCTIFIYINAIIHRLTFRSRCKIFWPCMNSIPSHICRIKTAQLRSVSTKSSSITLSKSSPPSILKWWKFKCNPAPRVSLILRSLRRCHVRVKKRTILERRISVSPLQWRRTAESTVDAVSVAWCLLLSAQRVCPPSSWCSPLSRRASSRPFSPCIGKQFQIFLWNEQRNKKINRRRLDIFFYFVTTMYTSVNFKFT